MRASSLASSLLLLSWLVACGDSTGDDGTAPISTTSDSGPTSTSSSPGSTDDTSSPATSEGSSGTPPGTTGPGPGSSDGDPSTGPGDESGSVCEPTPPMGDVCLECVQANCCTAWQACMNDEPCACVVDCHVVQGGSLGMCSNSCNLDSDLYQALYFCGQGSCLGNCDWDCC